LHELKFFFVSLSVHGLQGREREADGFEADRSPVPEVQLRLQVKIAALQGTGGDQGLAEAARTGAQVQVVCRGLFPLAAGRQFGRLLQPSGITRGQAEGLPLAVVLKPASGRSWNVQISFVPRLKLVCQRKKILRII